MKLTEKQERMVYALLKRNDETVEGLSPKARAQTMSLIRTRLKRELERFGDKTPNDDEVMDVLKRYRVSRTGWHPPGEQKVQPPPSAPQPTPDPPKVKLKTPAAKRPAPVDPTTADPTAPAPTLAAAVRPAPEPVKEIPADPEPAPRRRKDIPSDGRVWLGLCGALAERYGVDPGMVRAVFVTFGIFTGPFALILYLFLYFESDLRARDAMAHRIDRAAILKSVSTTAATAFAIYAGAFAVLRIGAALYLRFMANELVIGGWGWLERYQHILFFWSLFALVPLAVLAVLPLNRQWRETIGKVVRAGLALYAVIICGGIAAAIVGTILVTLQDFVG